MLLDVSLQYRVIIGISAMVLLFASFLIAFVSNQRKKLQYHQDLRVIQEKQQQDLILQNIQLEDRVRERTLELSEQKENLQVALADLRSTQSQLIQSEKMASLGELTAGIAHEIQNPLNFVNNFSEVNKELIAEASAAIQAGQPSVASDILATLLDNHEKIHRHGQRAESIVKGMLQHSRADLGHKETTDINALAEEYLRLSFQGLRAKDKAFNATLDFQLDGTIGKISVIPQEIGRVLLNLYNNAFYSISEKKRLHSGGYEPTVQLKTVKSKAHIEIRIKDNGNGIPTAVREKIFQPFFTTKPAGQGTGLGLSISYDIVKAHGGQIQVETKEGMFTEFIIQLPI